MPRRGAADRRSLIPSLAGQSEAYLLDSLRAYSEGTRASGVMAVAISALKDEELPALASAYAERARRRQEPAEAKPAMAELGRKLAELGDPARRIPACLSCHEKPDANPAFPAFPASPPPICKASCASSSPRPAAAGPIAS